MTDLENNAKQELTESRRISECPPEVEASTPMTQESQGTPVSVNVNMTASGKEHVNDLLAMMKAAGLDNAQQMNPDMMPPMRQDMERFKTILDKTEEEYKNNLDEYDTDPDQERSDRFESMEYLLDKIDPKWSSKKYSEKEAYKLGKAVEQLPDNQDNMFNAPEITDDDVVDLLDKRGQIKDDLDEYDNEPDEEYRDHEYMTKDLSGGLNREKKAYKAAQDGDNAMSVESIKDQLYAALSEKKAKPDYIDLDSDGDTKEPMKKAAKDKKSKKKDKVKEADSSQTQTNLMYMRKGPEGKEKDKKYFLMDYEMPHGVHNRQAFTRQIEENPIVQKLREEGYQGPEQLAGWKGNIDDAIEEAKEMFNSYKNKEKNYPSQYYGAKRRLENLQTAKKIINSGKLVS